GWQPSCAAPTPPGWSSLRKQPVCLRRRLATRACIAMTSSNSRPRWVSTTPCIAGVVMRRRKRTTGRRTSPEPDMDVSVTHASPGTTDLPSHGVTLREAFWTWLRVAALSFGGPAGQIAVMHRILVEEKRWVSEERFLHALNYCM